MPIKVTCASCNKSFKAPDNAAGKKTKCPQCGGIIEIPTPEPFADLMEAEVAPTWGFDDEDFEVAPPVDLPAADDRKPCPKCGEFIARQAVKCRFCGEVFDPALKKKMKKKRSKGHSADDEDLSGLEWVVAILCSGIGCIVGLIWMIQGKPKGQKMLAVSIIVQVIGGVIRVMVEMMNEGQQ